MKVELHPTEICWIKTHIKYLSGYIRDYTAMGYEIVSISSVGLFGNRVLIVYKVKLF